jgi:bifunctional non-homologous end joining protein LigD
MKFMQIKPQKARGKLIPSMWTDPQWVAEEKYDGDRRIAQFCGELVRFTGTRESVDGSGYVEKSANIPHLSNDWQGPMTATEIEMSHRPARHSPRELVGTVLDGEIVCPETKGMSGGKSKYVTAVMGSLPERAIVLQGQNGWMEYMVFDCLWLMGKDVRDRPQIQRRDMARSVLKIWNNKYAKLVEQHKNKKAALQEILYSGREGVILKHMDHTYGNEKLWVKVKGEWTADVVIMGYTRGKGKYANQVGAIIFGQHRAMSLKPGARNVYGLDRMGQCSGFDDETRRAFTDVSKTQTKYIGKVIEIKHNGREPTGAFRHPRFKRFRPDKQPKDCIYREDET